MSTMTLNNVRMEKLSYGPIPIGSWPSGNVHNQDYHQAKGPWTETLEVEDEHVVWEVTMPKTPKDNIKLFQLGDQIVLRAPYMRDGRLETAKPAETRLDLPEQVKFTSIKLELGVLRVVLERPNKKVALEIQ
jgi:HSP20 family molecular chaperone IbpA